MIETNHFGLQDQQKGGYDLVLKPIFFPSIT